MAMFPLGIFLLPNEEMPLRIFEPRYKQLIGECEGNGSTFGIPYLGSNGELKPYGSEVVLLNVLARNSKGEMVILIKGVRNFHLLDFTEVLPGKLYGSGIIEYVDDSHVTTNQALATLARKLGLDADLPLQGDCVDLFAIAKSTMLNSSEKFALYSLRSTPRMEQYLMLRLRYLEQLREQEMLLENNFSLN